MTFGKAKEILTNVEKYIEAKSDTWMETTKLVALESLIPAVILAIAAFAGFSGLAALKLPALGLDMGMAAATAFIGTIIGSILLLVVGGLVLHVFALLLGGKGTFNDSVAAMGAFMTPLLLLGWIPFINMIAGIYSAAIIVIAVAKKHKLTMFNASISIALPAIILALVAAYLASLTVPAMIASFVPALVR